MKLSITGSEIFTLAAGDIDKIIRAGDSDAALLYLYMLRTHGSSTREDAARALGMGLGQVNTATALLSRLGLIEIEPDAGNPKAPTGAAPTTGTPKAQTGAPTAEHPKAPTGAAQTGEAAVPAYTQAEVIEAVASGTDFTIVVDETERKLGKPLSPDELLRLYGIYDNLRLPAEVILQLITHCIAECRHSGDGRLPTVRYIEKAAYTWEREGIFTIEKAEEYLKALELRRTERYKIKQALQIRGREFSETEKRYVDGWLEMGFGPEAIAEAYDRTVVQTGSLAYPYMDKILKTWHSKGLHTPEQIQEKDARKKPGAGRLPTSAGSAASRHGEPNREQIERMTRLIKKMDEE